MLELFTCLSTLLATFIMTSQNSHRSFHAKIFCDACDRVGNKVGKMIFDFHCNSANCSVILQDLPPDAYLQHLKNMEFGLYISKKLVSKLIQV